MNKFNNENYEHLILDLLNEIYYVKGISNRSRITKVRQYTEILVRRILNLPEEKKVTLGEHNIKKEIKKLGNSKLTDAINIINKVGSPATHTQNLKKYKDQDVEVLLDKLLYVYSYLLITYFEKYQFGNNPMVVSQFSLLPPIVRYLVLKELYSKYPNNVMVIDKLTLAILKAFDKEKAMLWIEDYKKELQNKSAVAGCTVDDRYGTNMYDVYVDNISVVADDIFKYGKLYTDFESALSFYKSEGELEGDNSEIIEFNDIMQFLFMGRKSLNE